MVADRPPSPVDAYAIWLRARSAVTAARYPSRLDYTIEVGGLDGQTPAEDHYRAGYDSSDGTVRLFSISEEALAKPPPMPHGVNVSVNLFFCWFGCFGIHQKVGRPEPALDLLGEPLLTPVYAFGMRYATASTSAPVPSVPSLPVIAIVSAQKPEYRVALIDAPVVDGVATDHLALTPLRNPHDNRLRELWIGADDYLPRKAIVSGNFTRAPMVDVPWTVDFSVVDGAPYIRRESADDTLLMAHGRVVRQAFVAFENVREWDGTLYHQPLLTPKISETTLVEP